MLAIILGIFLLLWPITTIPKLIENKKKSGLYFTKDRRIIVSKAQNAGNNLNMQNKIAFTIESILGLTLVVYGVLTL